MPSKLGRGCCQFYSSYNALAWKHSPERVPTDPEARKRWAAITPAYETLNDPQKKLYCDTHGQAPAELEDREMSQSQI